MADLPHYDIIFDGKTEDVDAYTFLVATMELIEKQTERPIEEYKEAMKEIRRNLPLMGIVLLQVFNQIDDQDTENWAHGEYRGD